MTESKFLKMVHSELISAKMSFPPMNTVHEGYAVILEEVDELWAEVKIRQGQRSVARLREELIQIAAMCNRLYDDLLTDADERI